jgi:Domain of unknown function (DUF4288)
MERFAAKLLFQFRIDIGRASAKRRTCEERIINYLASDADGAVGYANAYGRRAQHAFVNDDGNPVLFEFVGVMDIAHLGIECGPEEVWYDIRERLAPRERSSKLVLSRRQLLKRLSR